jgi:ABC-2 type transport system permease protein
MAMIGGGMVPYFFLQRIPAMAMISNVSPVKWSIVALEGAIWRGFTPAQMALPCTILIGIAGFAIGSTLFQRLERH